MPELRLTSPAFREGERIPIQHTGRGADQSPELRLEGLSEKAAALAVILVDASHPIHNYAHWLIWNLPPLEVIPAAIPAGAQLEALGGAVQGMAYGRNRYRGPKPPLNWNHSYVFTVYVLDSRCPLRPNARKRDLLKWMDGHILQEASLSGTFQNGAL